MTEDQIREWVFDKLENTELDKDEMEQEFIKKFGKQNLDQYEAALSEYLD